MDVKLKKEYSHGWLLNFQAGYGTSDRYLGRLFASWFSPTTSLVITGTSNNLNDTRTPGQSDSWTPEKMPSGTMKTHQLSVNYNHEKTDQTLEVNGGASVHSNENDYRNSTSAISFLPGGDSYERRFNNSKSSSFGVNTWHSAMFTIRKQHRVMLNISGDYGKTDNNGDALSGTFNEDYSDISHQALETIYSDASAEALKAIVNRSSKVSEGRLRSGSVSFTPSASFKLPGSNDRININAFAKYVGSKRYSWNDYTINFGSDPTPSDRRRQYTDESPNYKMDLGYNISYMRTMRNANFQINYEYQFSDAAKDSYMYALERLEDMGIFGVLPPDYASALDPSNSYTSRTFTNSHTISINYGFAKNFKKSRLSFMASPSIGLEHRHFDYWRDNRNYLVKHTSVITPRSYAVIWLRYSFGTSELDEHGNHYNHTIEYRPGLITETPELLHLVDVVNTDDPLNIQEGNPDLRNSYTQTHCIGWRFTPYNKPIQNYLNAQYSVTSDDLVRGYVYDTNTGVRRHRTYNVSGNDSWQIGNSFSWQFGSQKQFGIGSGTSWSLTNSTDMLGINLETPVKTQVRNQTVSENIGLYYRIGKQMISANGSFTHRHTSSERPDFNTINAQHYKYGIGGVFALPAGFGASTDIYFYKRVGYGVDELDTTDAVWNLRLTYTPRGGKWVFSADGFDLLHKLSNVNYAVTATGRTVTYTNTLPRYFIFTVQYRLNIQPKK